MIKSSSKISLVAAVLIGLVRFEGLAQFLPADAGTTVNGFQDNFTNSVRDPNWVYVGPGADHWVQTNGVMQCGPTPGDPNHLLFEAPGYNAATQEVLVRIRVTAMPALAGSGARAGVGVGCDPATTQGQPGSGINWHLTDLDGRVELNTDDIVGRQARMLNDYVVWGPGFTNTVAPFDIPWQMNQWYWLRLRQEGTDTSAGNNIFAKVWLADGSEAEPVDWQLQWAQPTGNNVPRAGFAGLTGPTQNILTYVEVDYFLLKAQGLPSITVAPVAAPVYLNAQPQSVTQAPGKTATFSVVAVGSSDLAYQWQKATAGGGTFADIAGATASSYTTPAIVLADDGSQYRVVVSLKSGSASIFSLPASLSVDTPPNLLAARTAGSQTNVTVVFDKSMAVPADVSGFVIDHGIVVSGVTQGELANELVLTT